VIVAVTGATGFVGSRLLPVLRDAGHEVRALTRRPMTDGDGLAWVSGSLEDPDALARLAEGADALIHVAGVINAADAYGFELGNVAGTDAILTAARAAGVRRFVHVSSLAAREPELSRYGASKAKSETLVRESGLDFAIVRPPAVYGPGDREILELFKMARRGWVILPPAGRLSLLHADDLAKLLTALADPAAPSAFLAEPDDGRIGGWSHREFAEALAEAVGRGPARSVHMPRAALHFGAVLDRLVRRDRAKLTADRVAYFCHPDWVSEPMLAVPSAFWTPAIETRRGLKATADWYRSENWL
jgi:nucleoside-diphosphate-sugar epimerase